MIYNCEAHSKCLLNLRHRNRYYYTILHYVTLRYVTLHYNTLYYITLHYVMLRYITLHYITLRYITLHYITLRYVTLRYVTLHYITLRYVTSRYVMLCYAMLCYVMLCYIDEHRTRNATLKSNCIIPVLCITTAPTSQFAAIEIINAGAKARSVLLIWTKYITHVIDISQ